MHCTYLPESHVQFVHHHHFYRLILNLQKLYYYTLSKFYVYKRNKHGMPTYLHFLSAPRRCHRQILHTRISRNRDIASSHIGSAHSNTTRCGST